MHIFYFIDIFFYSLWKITFFNTNINYLLKVTVGRLTKTKKYLDQKKSFMCKISARSIPIYPAKLATFEASWIFGCPKRPFWATIIFFSSLSIFYLRWPLLRWCLHILNCDRAKITCFRTLHIFWNYEFFFRWHTWKNYGDS